MMIFGTTSVDIADCVRALVKRGELAPGASLPPVRTLAETLKVNRNTVAAAYQRLVQAGIAVTNGRLGTAICHPPTAGEQEGRSAGTSLIDLSDGNPNAAWLPDHFELLAGRSRAAPVLYGDETILPELKSLAEDWLSPDCPARCSIELTHGAVDAVERIAMACLVAGDKVAVEDPCFLGTISALRFAGMRTTGVGMDEAGMRPESLRAALDEGARAVLLTPRAHNPTGASLTKRRAEALKKVLSNFPGVLVLVDDHFGLFGETPYFSVVPPSTQRWALLRSVSKALGPDLRVAFVASDSETASALRTRLAPGVNWVSRILQTVVFEALRSAAVRSLVEQARAGYGERRETLRLALLGQGIRPHPAAGGLNLWIPVLKDPKDVAYEMAKRGWLVRLGGAFTVQARCQAVRVTVSRMSSEMADAFSRDFRAALG